MILMTRFEWTQIPEDRKRVPGMLKHRQVVIAKHPLNVMFTNEVSHETSSPYHCYQCYNEGNKVARFILWYKFENPKFTQHTFYHTFPCMELLRDWVKPFAKLGAKWSYETVVRWHPNMLERKYEDFNLWQPDSQNKK